jgi:hypothetical protein
MANIRKVKTVRGATVVQIAHKHKDKILSRVAEMLAIIMVLVHLTPQDPKNCRSW